MKHIDEARTGATRSTPAAGDRPTGLQSSGVAATRRAFVTGGAATTAGLLAGCLGLGGDVNESAGIADELPTVEDPPDVVYTPSHREGVEMLEPVQSGEYVVGAMLSYAHPFWTITGDDVEPVEVGDADDVHLMATVWDAETETVLPTDEGVTMRIYRDGELIDERTPWSMLSQTMGFHFGDNFPLDGDGTYELEVELPPPDVRTTGAFEGRFEAFETVRTEFTYDESVRDALVDRIEYFDEDVRGVPGAIESGHGHGGTDGHGDEEMDGHGDEEMDGHHEMPVTVVPEASALPGRLHHDAEEPPRSHDADVPVAIVEDFHGTEQYLLVSPRTPYNRIPLPATTLTASVTREGSEVATHDLVPTLDDEAGFHYGTSLDDVEPGDQLTVVFESPPQAARHQGYETAFVDMEPIELAVEGW